MTDHRDAITGQYVTAEHAQTNPDTTVSEARIRIEPVEFHATYGVTLSGTPSDPAKLTRATGNPDTTVSENTCAECEWLRGVGHTLRAVIDDCREEIERLRAEPIVRTVGDLTARHLGQEVRIPFAGGDIDIDCRLTGLRWVGGGYVECALDPDGGIEGVTAFPLDTPCEVLP